MAGKPNIDPQCPKQELKIFKASEETDSNAEERTDQEDQEESSDCCDTADSDAPATFSSPYGRNQLTYATS